MSTSGKPEKKLKEERRWSRIYELGPYPSVWESKFGTGEASISVEELARAWESWSESERLEFASAYNDKLNVSQEDEKVLEFLMGSGDERIWVSIAFCLTRHSDKKKILRFLLERLESGSEPKANFTQALRWLGDPEAVPSLLSLHDRLLSSIAAAGERASHWEIGDLISCCCTLWKLKGLAVYEEEIRAFLNHPNELVRGKARMTLEYG